MDEKLYFSSVIKEYDKGRSSYPKELFEEIAAYSQVDGNSNLLEIGAGPGTATEAFKGYHVDALEISEEQVAFLKNRFCDNKNIHPMNCKFEDFVIEKEYDLLYSATAFHWIEPRFAYAKAADCLKEGGTLAVFWNVAFAFKPTDGIAIDLYNIVRRYCRGILGEKNEDYAKSQQIRWSQYIYQTGLFSDVTVKEYTWKEEYDAERFICWVKSLQSVYTEELTGEGIEELTDYFKHAGGVITIPQKTFLLLAKKVKDRKEALTFVARNDLESVVELEELGKKPFLLEKIFLNYGEEIIYVENNGLLYGIVTPNDVIAFLSGNTQERINRNYRCIRENNTEMANTIFETIPTIHEVPVVTKGMLVGVIRNGVRKRPIEWKNIRARISGLVGKSRGMSLSDLFLSLSVKEQEKVLESMFPMEYIKLFKGDYEL